MLELGALSLVAIVLGAKPIVARDGKTSCVGDDSQGYGIHGVREVSASQP